MPNTSPIDLLTIGDCSIDLFMKVPDSATGILNEPTSTQNLQKMCFNHGSKIMVESFQTSISGNSVNVAIGAELLGLKTAIYTETGDDSNANRIEKELNERDVATDFVVKNPATDTALHTVVVYKGERTIFSYHGKREYKIQNWTPPKFIYYTSIGEGFENFQKSLIEYVESYSDIGVAFNPGTFQMAKGIDALKNVLAITDILFVNKEEAEALTNLPANAQLTDLHAGLLKFDVKLSVITNGKYGASAYDGTQMFEQGPYSDDRPVVDMTGAGDAFSAGFMAAIIYGKSLPEALKWGVVNSGSQIKVVGSVDGMLNLEQLKGLV